MSSVVNRLEFGEINTGSGQLGSLGYTTSAALITSNRYCNVYVVDVAVRNPVITLPVIGSSGVIPGWRSTFIISYPVRVATGTLDMNSVNTIQIVDSTSTLVTLINTYPAATAGTKAIVQVRVNAIAEPNTWLVEQDAPYWATLTDVPKYVYMGNIINYSNGLPAPRPYGATSRLCATPSITNINVLFVIPVTLTFLVGLSNFNNCGDTLYYTLNETSDAFVVNIAGMYSFKIIITLLNAGGGTSANVRYAILKNGIVAPSIIGTSSTGSTTANYIYAYIPFAVGDTFSFIAGKIIVSPGTTTIVDSTLAVEWICP